MVTMESAVVRRALEELELFDLEVEDLDGEAPKKGKKKPILVVLLVLLMAGGGAAFMLMPGQAPDEHAAAPIPEPVIVEPEKLFYIDLDPLFVPFKTPAGARHKVVVMLSLEVGRSRHQ